MSEDALNDQGQAKGEKQAIQMVKLVQTLEHGLFNEHARSAHQQRGEYQ